MMTSQGCRGRTFVRGFVRNYARLLNLDAEAVLASLPGGTTPLPDSPLLHPTAPTMGELPTLERSKSSWTRWAIPLTLVAVIAAVAVYEFSRGRDAGTHDQQRRDGSGGSAEQITAAQPTPAFASPPNQVASQSLPNPLAGKDTANASAQSAAGAAPGGAGTRRGRRRSR
jgi:cytoskeleton protein RodZ